MALHLMFSFIHLVSNLLEANSFPLKMVLMWVSDLTSFKSVKVRKLWTCFWGKKIWLNQMGNPKEIWNHHFSHKFIWYDWEEIEQIFWHVCFYNRPPICRFKWIFHFSWIYVGYMQQHKHIRIPATVNVEIIFVIPWKKTKSIFSLYKKLLVYFTIDR